MLVPNVDALASWIGMKEPAWRRKFVSSGSSLILTSKRTTTLKLRGTIYNATWSSRTGYVHSLEADLDSLHEESCSLHFKLLCIESLHARDSFALHMADMEKATTKAEVLHLRGRWTPPSDLELMLTENVRRRLQPWIPSKKSVRKWPRSWPKEKRHYGRNPTRRTQR